MLTLHERIAETVAPVVLAAQNTILLCCSDMSQMGDAGFEFFWLPLASLTNSVDLRSNLQR